MALQISTGLANAQLDRALNTAAGGDFDGGVLEIRTGAAPGPDAADGGTLLASITLPGDAFAAAASRSAAKSGTWDDNSADATGVAAHFRIKQSGDAGGASTTEQRIEGTVTGTGGGGDLTVDNTSFAVGQSFSVTGFALTQ